MPVTACTVTTWPLDFKESVNDLWKLKSSPVWRIVQSKRSDKQALLDRWIVNILLCPVMNSWVKELSYPQPQRDTTDVLKQTVYCRLLPSLGYCQSFVCELPCKVLQSRLCMSYEFRGFSAVCHRLSGSRRLEGTLNFGRCRHIVLKRLKPLTQNTQRHIKEDQYLVWIILTFFDQPSTQVIEGVVI